MLTATAPSDRPRRTRTSGERDIGCQTRRQRRSDALYALQGLQAAERAGAIPIGHDAPRQRGPDAGQDIQLLEASPVDIYGPAGFCGRAAGALRRARRDPAGRTGFSRLPSPARRPPPAGGDGRVHGRQLRRQRGARVLRDGRRRQGAAAAHTDAECRDRRHEQQGATLRGSGHAPRVRQAPSRGSIKSLRTPAKCGSASRRPARTYRNSRSTVIATSPTACSVSCEILSSVSCGVWCHT